MRDAGPPRGPMIFRAAGAEPALSIWEVAGRLDRPVEAVPEPLDGGGDPAHAREVGNASGLEIERKWLLAAAPSSEWLRAHGAVAKRIEQVYLRPGRDEPGGESGGRRVRRIETDAGVEHVETRKRARSGFTREEVERSIEAAEYERSLDEAEPSRQPVRKTRWVFPYAGHQLELDVFEVPAGVVLLEIELDSEDEPVELPPDLPVVREVTDDRAFLNWNLARRE